MLNFALQIIGFVFINMIVVSGLTVLYGSCGQVSLAQGAFFGIGAYAMALASRAHIPSALGLVIALAVSAVFGVIIALPALRLKGHYLAMGTLAFAELTLWFFNEATPVTGGVDGISNIGGFGSRLTSMFAIVAILLVVLYATYALMKGMPGKCMRALDENEAGAQACGVDIARIKTYSYIYSAVVAGLGGALYAAFVGFISPSLFASSASIMFLAMAVIGSRHSFAGPLIAVVALTLVQYASQIIPMPSESVKTLVSSIQVDLYALLIIGITLFQARRERS